MILCAVFLGISVLLSYVAFRQQRQWYSDVRADIYSLASKRPPDVSRGEWENMVGCTINLHANCGHSVDTDWRDRFAAELKRRLQAPVDVATIDWIWDEYVRFTKVGKSYSDMFRPTTPENRTESDFGMHVD